MNRDPISQLARRDGRRVVCNFPRDSGFQQDIGEPLDAVHQYTDNEVVETKLVILEDIRARNSCLIARSK